MLVIRMQRTGRKGHAQFRVVVQDSRRTPTSGKIVALVGTYDPHSKQINLNKERAEHYLSHGARPSPRVVRILKAEKIKLPKWVEGQAKKEGKTRNLEKLRRNRPAEPEAPTDTSEASAGVDEEAATGGEAEENSESPSQPDVSDNKSDTAESGASSNDKEPVPDSNTDN